MYFIVLEICPLKKPKNLCHVIHLPIQMLNEEIHKLLGNLSYSQ